MKIILLMLSVWSLNSMGATSLSIFNLSDDRERIEVSCLEVDCSRLTLTFNYISKEVSLKKINKLAGTKIPLAKKFSRDEIKFSPYSLSIKAAKRSYNGQSPKVLWKDGYEFSASLVTVGRGLEITALGLVDTIVLPISTVNYLSSIERDSAQLEIKHAAEKILNNLKIGKDTEISVKDRRFEKFRKIYYSI